MQIDLFAEEIEEELEPFEFNEHGCCINPEVNRVIECSPKLAFAALELRTFQFEGLWYSVCSWSTFSLGGNEGRGVPNSATHNKGFKEKIQAKISLMQNFDLKGMPKEWVSLFKKNYELAFTNGEREARWGI